ncbi:MAG: hypothetical protein NTV34_17990 [Proteobacteria bacterium]|nr:hypothetical protein [Pseudomonadota bacterium]
MIKNFLMATGFVLCAHASQGVAATSACEQKDLGVCVETNNPDVRIDCEDGVVVASCPAEARTGSCVFGDEATGVIARFYPAFTADAKAECESSDGRYIAGK